MEGFERNGELSPVEDKLVDELRLASPTMLTKSP
jgi:hypothetical protein